MFRSETAPASPNAVPLAALRRLFPAHGLDGYLVPRGDEHLGEDVPAAAERLRVLSGFTGSAGLAVVLPDVAALFTDGRYVLQAAAETGSDAPDAAWRCLHSLQQAPRDWLATLNRAPLRLGYDPMLFSAAALAALRGRWGELVPVAGNLVDAAWPDRPAPPRGPAQTQDPALAGRTVEEKLALVGDTLSAAGEDAAVLSDPASACWLCNLRGDDLPHTPAVLAHAVVRRNGSATLFLDPDRIDAALRDRLGAAGVAIVPPDRMADALDALAGSRVRVDPARSPVWFEQRLAAAGAEVSVALDPCLMFKARKTAAELDAFRDAHRHDGAALTRFLFWVRRHGIGHTEHEASERLLRSRLETGACSGASFDSIAAVGANAALMHYRPTASASARLEPNRLFLIDSGGQYAGATTDVTRTVWLGPDAPPGPLRRQFTRVLQGLIALTGTVFPDGTSGHRLDTVARLPLWRDGLDFDHGAGHGLGSFFAVHEWPYAFTPRPPGDPVHESMVLTNEPGFYLPGSHGIRLENAMAARSASGLPGAGTGNVARFCRFETLTLAPIDRVMVDAALLAPFERDWLDDYHALVAATLGPLLDDQDRTELAAACAPLSAP